MAFGAVLAVLVAQLFGKNADTDAFFAAYGVYAIGLSIGGTFRLTAIPQLVHDEDGRTSTRMLGAVALMCAALLVPMVLLAEPLGGLLVEQDPGNVAPQALRILWVALAAQVLTALLAAVLSVRGQFVALGLSMLLAGFVSLPVFLLTEGSAGVQAAAIAVAAGGAWQVCASLFALGRRGWRPHRLAGGAAHALGAFARQTASLLTASTPFLAAGAAYVICLAITSREDLGDATMLAYAFMLATILLGLTGNVAAQVRSPSVVAARDRTGGAVEAAEWTLRFSLLLTVPVLVLAWLAGGPVIGFVLGDEFSDDDVTTILVTLACLTGYLFASAAWLFGIVELLARRELGTLALIAGLQVLVTAGLALLAASLGGVALIATALSLGQIAAAWTLLRLAFGDRLGELGRDFASALARALVVAACMAAAGAALLLLAPGGDGARLAAGALAAVAGALATLRVWPAESRSLLSVLRRA